MGSAVSFSHESGFSVSFMKYVPGIRSQMHPSPVTFPLENVKVTLCPGAGNDGPCMFSLSW
jgi:hypothetical protein